MARGDTNEIKETIVGHIRQYRKLYRYGSERGYHTSAVASINLLELPDRAGIAAESYQTLISGFHRRT